MIRLRIFGTFSHSAFSPLSMTARHLRHAAYQDAQSKELAPDTHAPVDPKEAVVRERVKDGPYKTAAYQELPPQPDVVTQTPFTWDEAMMLLDEYQLDGPGLYRVATMLGISQYGDKSIGIDFIESPRAPTSPPSMHNERDGRCRATDYISNFGVRPLASTMALQHAMSVYEVYEQMHRLWSLDPVEWRFWCFVCKTAVPLGRVDAATRPVGVALRGWSLCHVCHASPMCPRCCVDFRADLPCVHCVSAMQVMTLPARMLQTNKSCTQWPGRPIEWTLTFKQSVQLHVSSMWRKKMLQRHKTRTESSKRQRVEQEE